MQNYRKEYNPSPCIDQETSAIVLEDEDFRAECDITFITDQFQEDFPSWISNTSKNTISNWDPALYVFGDPCPYPTLTLQQTIAAGGIGVYQRDLIPPHLLNHFITGRWRSYNQLEEANHD